ncbi:MAG: hypothetical protein Q7K57_44715 [Burkholderiaceae bacterium]|nr:hypothetical protein [Burkholderiaceae bacterium]
MCIGSKPTVQATPVIVPAAQVPVPEVVKVDPKVEADKIDADATAKANTEIAARRTARRGSALSTGAGLAPSSALSAGKQTLGG